MGAPEALDAAGAALPLVQLPRLVASVAIAAMGLPALVLFLLDRSRRVIGLYALLALLLSVHLFAPLSGWIPVPMSKDAFQRVALAVTFALPLAAALFLGAFTELPRSLPRLSILGVPLLGVLLAAAAPGPWLAHLPIASLVNLFLLLVVLLFWIAFDAGMPRTDAAVVFVATGGLALAVLLDTAAERRILADVSSRIPLVAPAFVVFTALCLSVVADAGQRLFTRATRDALTGLLNRHTFLTLAEQEIQRAERTGRMVALAMLDIDHFKSFNDRFGHQTGDRVLAGVSRAIAETVRGIDLAGRYGGEEFAVLLIEAEEGPAMAGVERIRAAIATVTVPGVQETITASAGVAVHHGLFERRGGVADLVKRADAALYASKRAGRNRATFEAVAAPTRAADVRYR